jgi:hypothetical protein
MMDTQRYLLASTAGALLSPIFIAAAVTWADGTRWRPLGVLFYAFVFVAPFTIVGSFVILWPLHRLLSRYADRLILWGLVSVIAGFAGAAMLGLLRAAWEIFLVGALSGLCTAAVWLVAFHMTSAASAKVQ